jgi:predicted alpha/beta hydrolase
MNSQNLELYAADNYRLAATHYYPDVVSHDAEQFIVIGGATGVPRGFYKRFAQYAASRGVHVITTDYRGIGDSKQGSLKGFEMEYADWSRYDLAAAVQWAAKRGKVWLVGHSLASHAIGQLPDANVLQAAYICGGGAGWHGWMPRPERYKVQLQWHLIGPVMTRIYGYHPMSKLGMGEDLPIGVYRDWKHWCQYPHYFFDDPKPRARAIAARFAEVRIPIAAVAATDDLWAPPGSRDAFFKHFTNAAVERIDITPASLNVKAIGHMGYYRTTVGEQLWPQMMQWLQGKGLRISHA